MAHQVVWTKTTFELFVLYAKLSPIEIAVMETRILGWTRIQQYMHFRDMTGDMNISSISTLDRIIQRLKVKYDAAQRQHPDELPKRIFSSKELYMDKN